ncbi:hypothetical protein BHM03_00050035 [Ensete ventricosum]|nr:hypothetical protein BHM03_00050035 [Ensete ventricosum]
MLLIVDALSNTVGSISDLPFMLWRMPLSPPTVGGEPKVWCYCRYPLQLLSSPQLLPLNLYRFAVDKFFPSINAPCPPLPPSSTSSLGVASSSFIDDRMDHCTPSPIDTTVVASFLLDHHKAFLGKYINALLHSSRSLSFPSPSEYSSPCHLLGFHTLDQAHHFLAYYHRTLDLRYTPPLLSCPWPPLLAVFLHR